MYLGMKQTKSDNVIPLCPWGYMIRALLHWIWFHLKSDNSSYTLLRSHGSWTTDSHNKWLKEKNLTFILCHESFQCITSHHWNLGCTDINIINILSLMHAHRILQTEVLFSLHPHNPYDKTADVGNLKNILINLFISDIISFDKRNRCFIFLIILWW